jgi:hypothetical protein
MQKISFVSVKKRIEMQHVQLPNNAINVMDFGAEGDGITDDSKAIEDAITALHHSNKKILYFPKGVYVVGSKISFNKGGFSVVGASADSVILKGKGGIQIFHIRVKDSLRIENIQFDGSDVKVAPIKILGSPRQGKVTIKHDIFRGAHSIDIFLAGAADTKIVGNLFRDTGKGTGIYMIRGCNNIHILDNKFLYIFRGVYIVGKISNSDKKLPANTNIYFENNYMDLGWYMLPSRAMGEGKDVIYTKNIIFDSDANFKNLGKGNNVRILQPLYAGSVSSAESKQFKDLQANFLNVRKHDLIRVGNEEALIDSVLNKHTLKIEKWLNKRTLSSEEAPKARKRYRIYRINMAKIRSNTKHKIKVWKFYNFRGNEFTPTDGWKYEVLIPHPGYPFFATVNDSNFTIINNIFKRGWSDQISFGGNNALIKNNLVEDGQDMGITLLGSGDKVVDNTIIHQRTGISFFCSNSTFSHNKVIDCQWATDYYAKPRAYITVTGENNVIKDNIFKRNRVRFKPDIHSIIVGKKIKHVNTLNNRISGVKSAKK